MLTEKLLKEYMTLFLTSSNYIDKACFAKLFVRVWAMTSKDCSLPVTEEGVPWCFRPSQEVIND